MIGCRWRRTLKCEPGKVPAPAWQLVSAPPHTGPALVWQEGETWYSRYAGEIKEHATAGAAKKHVNQKVSVALNL
jgi:hypothetical protein